MQEKASYYYGLTSSLLCSFLWGTTYVCGRYLLGNGGKIDPLSLCLVRFAGGGLILLLLGYFISRKTIFSFSRKDIISLAGLSMIGIFGSSLFIFMGQKYSTAVNAAMIMNLSPLITMLICLFYGEMIGVMQVGGMLFSLAGCMLVVNVVTLNGFGYTTAGLWGDSMLFVAAALWAVYVVYSKPLVLKYGGLPTTAWALFFGAIQTALIYPFFLEQVIWPCQYGDWLVTAYFVIFPTAVGYWAWYEGLARIELVLVNVMQYLSPIFTIVLAMMFLGDSITFLNILGAVMVIIGVAVTGFKHEIIINYILKNKKSFLSD